MVSFEMTAYNIFVLTTGKPITQVSLTVNPQIVYRVIREKYFSNWRLVIFFHLLWKVYLPSINNLSPFSQMNSVKILVFNITKCPQSLMTTFNTQQKENVFRLMAFCRSDCELSKKNLLVFISSFSIFKELSN